MACQPLRTKKVNSSNWSGLPTLRYVDLIFSPRASQSVAGRDGDLGWRLRYLVTDAEAEYSILDPVRRVKREDAHKFLNVLFMFSFEPERRSRAKAQCQSALIGLLVHTEFTLEPRDLTRPERWKRIVM
jgi:hypothetical protein